MKIPSEIKALIESGHPAHLVTLNRDGSPQITLVWIGMEGDELVAAHLPKIQKVKNILRDPRVVVSLHANTKSKEKHTLLKKGQLNSFKNWLKFILGRE